MISYQKLTLYIIADYIIMKEMFLIYFKKGVVYFFYLQATLPDLFFLIYFILKKGLTKLLRASLISWGWLRTCAILLSASQVLGLQACATTPG